MTTVLEIANEHGLVYIINRGLGYVWDHEDIKFKRIYSTPVEYSYKLKTAAGNANAFRIHLHPGLKQATREEFISTFLHELAHVFDAILNGRTSHSYGWYEAMIRFGRNPNQERYHNISSCKSRKDRNGPLNLEF